MKRLLATTVFAFIASASMAQANDPETVKIRQKFDLPRYKVQDVTNYTGAVTDTTDSSLSGTNIQSLLQWCDVSTDGGVGDIYDFSRYTDEEQLVSNTAISSYGDVGAALESVTIFNYAELEDMLGGAGHIGDHILVDQLVWGTEQKGINTILAKGEVLEGSSASLTKLADVTDITGAKGGNRYGDILRFDQFAANSVQIANNWSETGKRRRPRHERHQRREHRQIRSERDERQRQYRDQPAVLRRKADHPERRSRPWLCCRCRALGRQPRQRPDLRGPRGPVSQTLRHSSFAGPAGAAFFLVRSGPDRFFGRA